MVSIVFSGAGTGAARVFVLMIRSQSSVRKGSAGRPALFSRLVTGKFVNAYLRANAGCLKPGGGATSTVFSRMVALACTKTLSLPARRSEEHTSELQSLMRISYAVF